MSYSNEKLTEQLEHLCNGTLTAPQHQELEKILIGDSIARQFYFDYIEVHSAMVDRGRRESAFALDAFEETYSLNSQTEFQTDSAKKTLWNTSAIKWLAGIAALILTGLVVAWTMQDQPNPIAAGIALEPEVVSSTDEHDAPLYVAQVVRVTPETVWGKNSAASDFLLRIRKGDRISIESGLVEVEYFSGAKLILHGPCVFVLTGENSGRLERGQLTGNVDGGNFFIATPNARVVDLGTEFGLSTTASGGTNVCVFDGEVEVVSALGVEDSAPLSLTVGMSAQVKRDGKIHRPEEFDTGQFTRTFPASLSKTENQLSLVDLSSASSKKHFRLAGVIAPDTGKADQSPWLLAKGPGHRMSNVYRTTKWHPYVDGVFIPTAAGSRIQLDSSAKNFVDLPVSQGRTWGPIWSRRKIDGDSSLGAYEAYWGTSTLEGVVRRLNKCKTGMIGLHSSVGVTFDLNAIGKLDFSPTEFNFTVSNLDNSAVSVPEWSKVNRFSADLRVFVDGDLRASRLDFTREDGELDLRIPLKNSDRFLTLVSSDCGRDGYDHVVVIDPVLQAAAQ